MESQEIYIDAEIIPPKYGAIYKVVPIQYFGVSEHPGHINRTEIVMAAGLNYNNVNVGTKFIADQGPGVKYYNFCKYCNV